MAGISDVNTNETVVFYPTFGRMLENRTWAITIRGTIFEAGQINFRRRLLIRVLQRCMKAEAAELESHYFQERIRGFITATERGKRIGIRIGSRTWTLQKRSKRNGHFIGTVGLPADEARELQRQGPVTNGWLTFEALTAEGDPRKFFGQAQLLDDSGISVISDIDDTIKHTQVTCRRTLLTNTFLRQFQGVQGMAALYNSWARQGAAFHYVSSSPWQLYDSLAELCRSDGFPLGTFHLRSFRLTHHLLRRMFLGRRSGKGGVIKSLLQTFPQRRFILVGDSGERDPELYGAIARRYPHQIAAIFIRNLPQRPLALSRWESAFRRIPPEMCRCFHEAQELSTQLPSPAGPLWQPWGSEIPLVS